jgi:hypothetical protein
MVCASCIDICEQTSNDQQILFKSMTDYVASVYQRHVVVYGELKEFVNIITRQTYAQS